MSVAIPAPLAEVFTASRAFFFLPAEMDAIRRVAHHELSIAGLDGVRENEVATQVASRVGAVQAHPGGVIPFFRKLTGEKFPHETAARYAHFLAAAVLTFADTAQRFPELNVNTVLHRHALWALDRHVGMDLQDRVHPSNEWTHLGANHHPDLKTVLSLKDKNDAVIEVPVTLFETGARIVFPDRWWSRVLRQWRGPLSSHYLNPAGSANPEKQIRGPYFSPRLDVTLFPRIAFCADAGSKVPATAAFTQARLTVRRLPNDRISFDLEPELPPTVSSDADDVIQGIANQRAAAFLYGVLLFLMEESGSAFEDTHRLMNAEIAPERDITWAET